MAEIDFNDLPNDRKDKLEALFAIVDTRIDEIAQRGSQVESVAIAGEKYAGGDSASSDGDVVSSNLFATIHGLAGDAQALQELRSALQVLRVEFGHTAQGNS